MNIRTHFVRFTFVLIVSVAVLFTTATANAQEIMPLSEIKKGDKGYGLTVFEGTKPEKFDFEVRGILNTSPVKYIVILLSGGPKDSNGVEIIKNAGVVKGMSGSPLFKDNKIIGALSGAWPYAKEPLASATPIENMVSFKNAALLLPNNLFYFRPIFPATFSGGAINDTHSLSAGDTYFFCDVWGDDYSCRIGTVTMAEYMPIPIIYTLGHVSDEIPLGPTAIPIWKGEVITVMANLQSSGKLAKEIGGIIGSVIFNGPTGQIAMPGAMPRSMNLVVTVEDDLKNKFESKSFLAYTPKIRDKISSIIIKKKSLIYDFSDIEAETRIDITGMPQILIRGALVHATDAGLIVKDFLGDELNPVVERIAVTLRARPKYKQLELKMATVEVKEAPIQRKEIFVEIFVVASGDHEWSTTLKLNLNKEYLGKKLHISRGEDVISKILLDPNFSPNIETVKLLNQVSEKDALYLYYTEGTDEEVKTKKINLVELPGIELPANVISLSQQKVTTDNKPTTTPTNGWIEKPGVKVIEILAKIDLPSNDYLIDGEKSFIFKLPEPLKKHKRFLMF